jgi:hypothetical protein
MIFHHEITTASLLVDSTLQKAPQRGFLLLTHIIERGYTYEVSFYYLGITSNFTMNKTMLGISALIVAISMGTTLVLTSDSRINQAATAYLAEDPKTPIAGNNGRKCATIAHVYFNDKGMCEYWNETFCADTDSSGEWLSGDEANATLGDRFTYQILPPQAGNYGSNGNGGLHPQHCLPPLVDVTYGPNSGTLVLPDAPHSQDYSVDKNLDLTFEFEPGYPKKLSEKEIEDRGVLTIKDIESYLQENKLSLNNLIAPSPQQIQAVYQQNILKKQ